MEERVHSLNAGHWRKRSLWSWAPIRAIGKILQEQFKCIFSIVIQTIDGLPSALDGSRLVVQVERRDKVWQTMPSRVFQHVAEFYETLHIETTVYGRTMNTQDRAMKFSRKEYILSVLAIDGREHLLLNQHCIDLSRLLPASLEGFWEPENPMSSTTSFKLGGEAQGAVLIATLEFDILNKEFRWPSLPRDGFGGSPFQHMSMAFKSLPNSPNPSPFVRLSDYHCTSPCASEIDSDNGIYIEKFDLDSSAKNTEESSFYEYSNSDEDRYRALRNDPLNLDAFAETEPARLSQPVRSEAGLGSLDNFKAQIHLSNTRCVEKAEALPAQRSKGNSLCHPIDVGRPLYGKEDGNEVNAAVPLRQSDVNLALYETQERIDSESELAADKHCINVEFVDGCPNIDSSQPGSDDICKEMVDRDCNETGFLPAPAPRNPSMVHSSYFVLTVEKGNEYGGSNNKHIITVNDEGSPDEKCCVDEFQDLDTCSATGTPEQDWRTMEGLQALLDCANEGDASCKAMEDVELDMFSLDSEDDALSIEASGVAEDFFNLLEIEQASASALCTCPSGFGGENYKQQDFSHECLLLVSNVDSAAQYEVQFGEGKKGKFVPFKLNESIGVTHCEPLQHEEQPHQHEQEKGVTTCFRPCEMLPGIQGEGDALQTICEDSFALLSIIEAGECEMKKAAQSLRSKERAKMLDDAETKALMKEYGLSEKTFGSLSPTISAPRLHHCPPESLDALGFTTIVSLKGGSTLRAISLDLFQPCSRLVMQVSKPVVLPTKSNICVVDILRGLALDGLENMATQAIFTMPLQDIDRSSVDQFIGNGMFPGNSGSNYCNMRLPLRHEHSMDGNNIGDEVVFFEDFTDASLRKIEPLVMEGLKVQCRLSKEAPYTVSVHCRTSGSGEHTQFMLDSSHRGQENPPHSNSLLEMAFPLDEWPQQCDVAGTGECGNGSSPSHSGIVQMGVEDCCKDEDDTQKFRTGISLTVIMLLQLRDPHRYFEPVGGSMMALVQAETVNQQHMRSNETIYCPEVTMSNHHKPGTSHVLGSKSGIRLKITGLHVSGMEFPDDKRPNCWGTKEQVQSASRWLLSNIRTNSMRCVMDEPASNLQTNARTGKGEFLWSISASVYSSTWRQTEGFCPFIRNPNITFVIDDCHYSLGSLAGSNPSNISMS